MISRFVMAHLLPPEHEVDIEEVEPAQPELAPAQQLPPLPNHLHPNFDEEEEEPFEDEEEEPSNIVCILYRLPKIEEMKKKSQVT